MRQFRTLITQSVCDRTMLSKMNGEKLFKYGSRNNSSTSLLVSPEQETLLPHLKEDHKVVIQKSNDFPFGQFRSDQLEHQGRYDMPNEEKGSKLESCVARHFCSS